MNKLANVPVNSLSPSLLLPVAGFIFSCMAFYQGLGHLNNSFSCRDWHDRLAMPSVHQFKNVVQISQHSPVYSPELRVQLVQFVHHILDTHTFT